MLLPPLYPGRGEDALSPPLACIPGKDEWFKGVLCLAPSIMKPCLDIAEKCANCKPRCRSAIFTAFISYSGMRGQVLNQITPSHPLPFIYSSIHSSLAIHPWTFIYSSIHPSLAIHPWAFIYSSIHSTLNIHSLPFIFSSFTIHLFIHTFNPCHSSLNINSLPFIFTSNPCHSFQNIHPFSFIFSSLTIYPLPFNLCHSALTIYPLPFFYVFIDTPYEHIRTIFLGKLTS